MIDFAEFKKDILATSIADYGQFFIDAVERRLSEYTHGELAKWHQLIDALPTLETNQIDLRSGVSIGTNNELKTQLNSQRVEQFIEQLKILHPWRKGPFNLFGIPINTEWRSDWKWDRLLPHISSLKNRTILDVGCGNGYHCWRMLGEKAKLVLGIDPSQKFLAQFAVIKKYHGKAPVHLLPLGIEDMPTVMPETGFDTIFSMGVLYHRKSPINHLFELKNLLKRHGELIIETLVIDGGENQVLVPRDRYAQMRNVWFLPSVSALKLWLARAGYRDVQTVAVNQTSTEEQRQTDWMHFHSLENYLDPNDHNLTIEGYPAPKRAILVAKSN